MAPVILPKPTRETEISIREMSWSRDLTPSGAGPSQRHDKLGTRHSIMFDIPVMRYAWCGAGVASDLALGRTGDGAAIEIPEPGVAEVDYGAPVVSGSGQLGSRISLVGLNEGVVIKKGKWLTLQVSGRLYAYFTTRGDVLVGSDGRASLDIYPMIRRSALDGSSVLLAKPMIQGLIKEPLQRKIVRRIGIGLSFEVEEQD